MASIVKLEGGLETACTVTGEGPPLLLLHGAEATHAMFDAMVPHLARHFTVIAYDQRDCGDTRNPETATTLVQLADDAHALLKALGFERAHVYGTSFGGRVAQVLALRHAACVQRLVLSSTWPLPHALAQLNPQGLRAIAELRGRLPETAEPLARYFFAPEFLEAQPQWKTFFASVKPASPRSLRRFEAVNDSPALDAADITLPTLLIAGELDQVVPPRVTLRMASQLPDAESVLLPGVAHASTIQAPELVARHIVRFCLTPNLHGAPLPC
jgi:3-oxoadipate enol-lactonase